MMPIHVHIPVHIHVRVLIFIYAILTVSDDAREGIIRAQVRYICMYACMCV